jgi:hypothetical protein
MKQEELFKTLIKELFQVNTTHQEYQDNDAHFVVDSQRNGNTLTIKVQLLENKDKKEFENWLQQIDDDFFAEVLEELGKENEMIDLNSMYNSKDYKKVISKIKNKTRELAAKKIKEFQKFMS